MKTPENEAGLEIPIETLTNEALSGILDDFILREGTDYGWQEISIEKKRQNLESLLRRGKAKLYFDRDTESITLQVAEDLRTAPPSE